MRSFATGNRCRVALITGASSGIGKAIASRLAPLGYELVLVRLDLARP